MVHDFDIWCTDPLVTIWGLTTTLNCTAKKFPGLMVLRVLLGCFESAIAPAYVHSPRTLLRPLLISFQIDPDHIDVVQKRRYVHLRSSSHTNRTILTNHRTTPKNGNMVSRYRNSLDNRRPSSLRSPLLHIRPIQVLANNFHSKKLFSLDLQ